ncbi:MAG TPA: zinc-ribbon domain containing protein [Capillibacterium sp.]
MFQDKTLVCRNCGAEFTFSASEQEFYAEKGFTNEPGRCPKCRAERKQKAGSNRYGSREPRQLYDAVCAACGTPTQVPFQPSGDRPVYCRNCYARRKMEY